MHNASDIAIAIRDSPNRHPLVTHERQTQVVREKVDALEDRN